MEAEDLITGKIYNYNFGYSYRYVEPTLKLARVKFKGSYRLCTDFERCGSTSTAMYKTIYVFQPIEKLPKPYCGIFSSKHELELSVNEVSNALFDV